ncbi:MAG: DsbA family protein [Oscillospiraceae bacterium]|jgi:predicted DsbA family dithiol-disulfide isomerase|nr:DsbA family protein [Oscillospiraceae bacterium]
MAKLEIFIDYTCPYCKAGFAYFKELLPQFPTLEYEIMPIEAHPRNEEPEHRPYVDLAVQAAYFVKAHGGDEYKFAELMFALTSRSRDSMESVDALADTVAQLGYDRAEIRAALVNGTYLREQLSANDYAYETQNVWAVPTFVCADKRVDAAAGVGVTKEQLLSLIREVSE